MPIFILVVIKSFVFVTFLLIIGYSFVTVHKIRPNNLRQIIQKKRKPLLDKGFPIVQYFFFP